MDNEENENVENNSSTEQQSDYMAAKENIDNRGLSSKSGGIGGKIRNFFPNMMNKFFGKGNKKKTGFEKIWSKIPLKVKLIIIGVAAALIIVAAIILLIAADSSNIASESMSTAISSLGIDESSSEADQKALELYNTYGSLIGFNDEQLEKIKDELFNDDRSRSEYLRTATKQKYGSIFEDSFDYDSNKTLFEHIERTEKYNFNNIVWKVYTHTKEGEPLETEKYESIGLYVPKGSDDKEVLTLLDTTAPFLLSKDIPYGMLCGMVAYSSRDNDRAGKFTYQTIKEAMTQMTVSKYVIKSTKTNVAHSETTIKKFEGYITAVYDNGTITVTQWPDYKEVSSEDKTTPEERVSNYEDEEETFWYVTDARTYDAKIENTFEHEPYLDSDAQSLQNPTSESLIDTTPINNITGDKVEGELTDSVRQKITNEALGNLNINNNNTFQNNSFQNNYTPNVKRTVTIKLEYTQEGGYRYTYEKEWEDKLTCKECKNKVFDENDYIEYNTKEEEEYKDVKLKSDKSIYTEGGLTGESYMASLTEQDGTPLYGLSLIDFFDSNSGVYKKYLNSTEEATYPYAGFGRYKLKQSYAQVKNMLKTLITKEDKENNTVPFVYGSSLGFEVTNVSYTSNSEMSLSGMNLLLAYIKSHEGDGSYSGGGTFTEDKKQTHDDAEGKYYKVYNAGEKNGPIYTVGYGININAHFDLVKEKLAETETPLNSLDDVEYGMLLDKEAIDSVQMELIQGFADIVDKETEGLELTEYQKHALISRAYVHGTTSVSSGASAKPFKPMYEKYWDEEKDDKYEELYEEYKDKQGQVTEISAKADLTNGLYTEFFDIYVSPTFDADFPGYEPRQRSEYILFSTGYYTTLKQFWTNSATPGNINLYNADGTVNEEKCIELQHWFQDNIFGGSPQLKCGDSVTGWDICSWGSKVGDQNYAYNRMVTHEIFKSTTADGVGRNVVGLQLFQCTWWAESRATLYVMSVAPDKFTYTSMASGENGGGVARDLANRYGVTFNQDPSKVVPNSIVSLVSTAPWHHVAYVEAVDYKNKCYYISHAGGGYSWYGVKKKYFSDSGFIGSDSMDDIINSRK